MHPQEMHTLTWNRYSDHLREMVNEMMTSSQFADVTLVTDDKQLIRAHRNILGACSPVFKNILNLDSSIANPVIYLRGIQNSEMVSIMQFIYQGKTSFNQQRLSELLTVSKNLEIKEVGTAYGYGGPPCVVCMMHRALFPAHQFAKRVDRPA